MSLTRFIVNAAITLCALYGAYMLIEYMLALKPEAMAVYLRLLFFTGIAGILLIASVLVAFYLIGLLAMRYGKPLDEETKARLRKGLE